MDLKKNTFLRILLVALTFAGPAHAQLPRPSDRTWTAEVAFGMQPNVFGELTVEAPSTYLQGGRLWTFPGIRAFQFGPLLRLTSYRDYMLYFGGSDHKLTVPNPRFTALNGGVQLRLLLGRRFYFEYSADLLGRTFSPRQSVEIMEYVPAPWGGLRPVSRTSTARAEAGNRPGRSGFGQRTQECSLYVRGAARVAVKMGLTWTSINYQASTSYGDRHYSDVYGAILLGLSLDLGAYSPAGETVR